MLRIDSHLCIFRSVYALGFVQIREQHTGPFGGVRVEPSIVAFPKLSYHGGCTEQVALVNSGTAPLRFRLLPSSHQVHPKYVVVVDSLCRQFGWKNVGGWLGYVRYPHRNKAMHVYLCVCVRVCSWLLSRASGNFYEDWLQVRPPEGVVEAGKLLLLLLEVWIRLLVSGLFIIALN